MQKTQAEAADAVTSQYGRNDVEFEAWYSPWMKQLARNYTRQDLERMLHGAQAASGNAARAHLRAIDSTASMSGCSARRAQTRNVAAAAGDTAIAIRGAIEIHDLFPEHGKRNNNAAGNAP